MVYRICTLIYPIQHRPLNPIYPYLPYQYLHFWSTPTPSPLFNVRAIVERVTTEWASALIASCKPLEQAIAVEKLLACLTALIWHLFVARHNAVTDGALRLAL